jgi:hypothetical protein
MSHLRILLGARLSGLKNRAAGRSPRWWVGVVGALVAVVGGLLWLGDAAAPGLLAPPDDIVTAVGMGEDAAALPAGAAALEAAFWLAALASSVLNFRVMELLFRRSDIRAVQAYPLRLSALYVDRLLAALSEAIAAAALLALFFVPLAWRGGQLAALSSVALIALGLLTSAAIGLAVQLAAGHRMSRTRSGGASEDAKSGEVRDIYGGSGQIFLYSPGVALALSVLTILLAKLALGEVLRAGEPTRAFGVGMAILAGALVISVALSFRYFVDAFPRMKARFHEADFVGFEVSAQHQTSAYGRARWGEGLLAGPLRPLFRTYTLQYGRRYMLARWSYVLGWMAAGLALFRSSEAALPMWLVATLPAVALATLVNPWVRLTSGRIRPTYQDLLAVSRRADQGAATAFAARECLLVTLPYALLVVLAHGTRSDWAQAAVLAALAIGGALALNGAMAFAWRLAGRSRVVELAVPLVVAIALVAVANVSLGVLGVVVGGLVVGHGAVFSDGQSANPSAAS